MPEDKKTKVVTIRLSEAVYGAYEALARADRRKLATYLGMILEDHLAAMQAERPAKPPKRK
jgi:hypothetical protein